LLKAGGDLAPVSPSLGEQKKLWNRYDYLGYEVEVTYIVVDFKRAGGANE